MKSIVDITWGAPSVVGDMVTVPLGMHVTDDDSPGRNINYIHHSTSTLRFAAHVVAKGPDAILAAVEDIIRQERWNYGPISVGRLRESIIALTKRHDFTKLFHPGWASPIQTTERH